MPDDLTAYLDKVAQAARDILGNDLVGVYLHGSGAQGDHRRGRSDLDVVGVTTDPISDGRKDLLAGALSHATLPVPSAGLDLMIVTRDAIDESDWEPEYEFWFSTGATWSTEIQKSGRTSEVLLTLAACHAGARRLCGRDANEVFRLVPREGVLRSMIDALEWHRTKILDGFHDPLGQHSILNASRNWMYGEDRTLGSKAEGGRWVLAREPGNLLVQHALRARDGQSVTPPRAAAIDAFLQRVIWICREALS